MRHARMLGPAKIYFIIFGVLTIAGGIVGYVKAGSTPSIIAGSITGILLLVGALPAWPHSSKWGYGPSGGIGLVLLILLILVLTGRI